MKIIKLCSDEKGYQMLRKKIIFYKNFDYITNSVSLETFRTIKSDKIYHLNLAFISLYPKTIVSLMVIPKR